jgi:hypothetical protein
MKVLNHWTAYAATKHILKTEDIKKEEYNIGGYMIPNLKNKAIQAQKKCNQYLIEYLY